jgi:hypothetical protein
MGEGCIYFQSQDRLDPNLLAGIMEFNGTAKTVMVG